MTTPAFTRISFSTHYDPATARSYWNSRHADTSDATGTTEPAISARHLHVSFLTTNPIAKTMDATGTTTAATQILRQLRTSGLFPLSDRATCLSIRRDGVHLRTSGAFTRFLIAPT